MVKNKKLLIIFILILAFLLIMVTYTKATDNVDELPTIIIDPNSENTQNPTNNEQSNNETNNNLENLNTNINTNQTANTNTGSGNVLPQTGVQGDAMLFIFISVCIVSAIYAYFKIRKYNV